MRSRDLDDTALPYRWFFLRGNFARNVMETLKVFITKIKLILIVCPAPATKYFSPTNGCAHSCHFHRINPIEGLNLWDEFDRARVLDFLRQLYSQNRLLQQVAGVQTPVHFSYRHGRHDGGHTTGWGGTFDWWWYALLSPVKQIKWVLW